MSLTIKPLTAVLDLNTDKIGKSDPYVVLVLGKEKQKTSVCKSGGKKPFWQDTLTFNSNETQLHVQLWDKDTFSKDDMIGNGVIDIKKVFSNPNQPITGIRKQNVEYVNLAQNGKPVGQVQIAFQYNGTAINQGGQGNFGSNPNQGNYGQQGNQGQGNWGQPNQGNQGQGNWGQPNQGNQGNFGLNQNQGQGQKGPQGQQGQQGQQGGNFYLGEKGGSW